MAENKASLLAQCVVLPHLSPTNHGETKYATKQTMLMAAEHQVLSHLTISGI